MARTSPFPPVDLETALIIPKTILTENSGQPMRRLTIFNILKKSPESSTSRSLLTASSGYGLTEGSYAAETIKLTERGKNIASTNDPQAKLAAVIGVPVFAKFFDNYRNATVPSKSAAIDFLKTIGLSDQNAATCLEVLLNNGEQVGLIQEISGVKRVVSRDHALEELTNKRGGISISSGENALEKPQHQASPASAEKTVNSTPAIPITMNIQIAIPSDATAEQYDMIFSSIKKYLIQPGQNA